MKSNTKFLYALVIVCAMVGAGAAVYGWHQHNLLQAYLQGYGLSQEVVVSPLSGPSAVAVIDESSVGTTDDVDDDEVIYVSGNGSTGTLSLPPVTIPAYQPLTPLPGEKEYEMPTEIPDPELEVTDLVWQNYRLAIYTYWQIYDYRYTDAPTSYISHYLEQGDMLIGFPADVAPTLANVSQAVMIYDVGKSSSVMPHLVDDAIYLTKGCYDCASCGSSVIYRLYDDGRVELAVAAEDHSLGLGGRLFIDSTRDPQGLKFAVFGCGEGCGGHVEAWAYLPATNQSVLLGEFDTYSGTADRFLGIDSQDRLITASVREISSEDVCGDYEVTSIKALAYDPPAQTLREEILLTDLPDRQEMNISFISDQDTVSFARDGHTWLYDVRTGQWLSGQ